MTTDHRSRYGPHKPAAADVAHAFAEQLVDLGEVEMNHATAGDGQQPALLTHHFRTVDGATGILMGAMVDVPVDHRSFPSVGHSMHGTEPALHAETLLDWFGTLGS